jgi:hypothetical protein
MARSQEFAGVPLVGTAGVFYNNRKDVRFELALATAEAYRDANLPYVVVDASPGQSENSWVADAHRERGAIVLSADIPGIATQRQQGVAYAVEYGADKIVGQEPEKVTLPRFVDEISRALDNSSVLVIGRTAAAENSLPPTQQRTERLAGWILEHTHGLPADALAGPRGFDVAGAAVLLDYPATDSGMNNWLYLYETPLEAQRRGLNIGGIAVDMIYPEKMVAEETDNLAFDKKRYDQFHVQLSHLFGESFRSSCPIMSSDEWFIADITRHFLPRLIDTMPLEERTAAIANLEQILIQHSGFQPADNLHVQ